MTFRHIAPLPHRPDLFVQVLRAGTRVIGIRGRAQHMLLSPDLHRDRNLPGFLSHSTFSRLTGELSHPSSENLAHVDQSRPSRKRTLASRRSTCSRPSRMRALSS